VQAILGDIGALMGVTGSFVCGRDGALVGRAMPGLTEDGSLATIGRALMRTLDGLEADRHKRPTELDFVFKNGLLLVKNLGSGCLCVLCGRNANVAMVNMTANMAARKLKDTLAAGPGTAAPAAPTPAPVAPAAPTPAPVVAPILAADTGGPTVALELVTQIEHELARLVGPVAMLAVDDAVGGLNCTRQTLPSGALGAWIERLGAEIADAAKRAQFIHAARKLGRLD
jgi:predicted regulator of Ras-like GTPase activity (Roadblock/LC7/MglB family)